MSHRFSVILIVSVFPPALVFVFVLFLTFVPSLAVEQAHLRHINRTAMNNCALYLLCSCIHCIWPLCAYCFSCALVWCVVHLMHSLQAHWRYIAVNFPTRHRWHHASAVAVGHTPHRPCDALSSHPGCCFLVVWFAMPSFVLTFFPRVSIRSLVYKH